MTERIFTVEEARALLPELRSLLSQANRDLDSRAESLEVLNDRYRISEAALDGLAMPDDDDENSLLEFRRLRSEFELAVNELSTAQREYLSCYEFWVDSISSHGVIIRRIKEGLLDFPACKGDFKYFLCWQFGERDISHWHPLDGGFSGRKELAVLEENS